MWVSVKYLSGTGQKLEFNVPVSEMVRLGNIFMSSFFKREMPPPSYRFIHGCPLVGNNNETFCIYSGAFWVQAVRLSSGLRKVDSAGTKNNEQRHYQPDLVS